MDKHFLTPMIRCSFNPVEVLNCIQSFPEFKTWNVTNYETLGDRGLLLHIKSEDFKGFVFIVVDENGNYIVRKLNIAGFVLLTNKIKYSSMFQMLMNLYLSR